MFDVITIGSATRDVFLKSSAWKIKEDPTSPTGFEQCLPFGSKVPIEEIAFTTGGGATNTAVTFARLGKLRSACVCRIGSRDTGGQAVVRDLKHEHIATNFVQQDPRRHTGYSMILLSDKGERTILVHRGASDRIAPKDIPWGRIRAKWLYVTSLGGDLALFKKILAHAKKVGAKVTWNPGSDEIAAGWPAIAPLARQCAVFNVNREEAATLLKLDSKNLTNILGTLCGKTSNACVINGYVLLTDGAGGAYVCDGTKTTHIASRNLSVVNATGAGDAFGSGFVLGLYRAGNLKSEVGNQIDYALRLAMANAEGVITHMGAKTGILKRVPDTKTLAVYDVREM